MSGSTTPNFQFNLPTIGGNQDSWGNLLNANWSSLDTLLNNAASNALGFLPLTGGAISGSLTVSGVLQVNTTMGVTGLVAFGYPTVNDFYIQRLSSGFRILHWSSTDQVVWSESGAQTFWQHNSSNTMSLDASGNLAIIGNASKPGGGSWAAASDDRVKRHVEPYRSGLDEICELRPISFEYNGEGHTVANGSRYVGLSAQHTKPIMPELVSEMPSGYLAIDQGALMFAVVNALQELADRIGALEHAA